MSYVCASWNYTIENNPDLKQQLCKKGKNAAWSQRELQRCFVGLLPEITPFHNNNHNKWLEQQQ